MELSGPSQRRTQNFGTNPLAENGSRDFQPIFLIVIQEQELGSGLIGKCFTQLLDDPSAGRMAGDIAVQDVATVMTRRSSRAVSSLANTAREYKRWANKERIVGG